MNKEITEYLNAVCVQIKSKQARLSARAELSGHIQTIMDELRQTGLSEEETVKTALARMGDPGGIGRQIASFNAPWQNLFSAAAGTLLLIAVFVWAWLPRGYLLDLTALSFVMLLTLAFVMIGGFSRLTRLSALARGRTAALYAGGIGMLTGIMEALSAISGSNDDLERFGAALSFCITSVLYGLIVSAFLTSAAHLYRPLEGNEIRRILGWENLEV